jgi:hypothetical protein
MKIKTISFEYERKLNLQNFESAGFKCSVWADVEMDDNPQTGITQLRDFTRDAVRAEASKLMASLLRRNSEVESSYLREFILAAAAMQPEELGLFLYQVNRRLAELSAEDRALVIQIIEDLQIKSEVES